VNATTRSLRQVLRAEWERTVAWTLATGAALMLFVGYRNLAASPFAAEEVAHLITGGIGALILTVGAVGLLLSADLRDETDKLDRMDARLGRQVPVPRRGRVRIAAAGAIVVGLATVTAGWARAAGTADFDRSLSGLALAVVGLALVVGAVAGGSLAARRTVRRRIGSLIAASHRHGDGAPDEVTVNDGREWTAEGLTRFHRRACPALASAIGPARVVDRPAGGLETCLICHGED
jgi:hypothetical protein